MNHSQLQAAREPRATTKRVVSAVSLGLFFAALAVVLFVALRSPLKDDIAWLLYVARRWIAGRELYVDVVEINPPLIVWISAIPIWLSRWLSIDSRFIVMPMFIVMVLACVGWSARLLRASGGIFTDPVPVFAVIGAIFLVVPAGDLGQREHLLTAAFLPYLVLFAQRLDGRRAGGVTLVAAGVLAGLGCALKPTYATVFAVLECLALTRGLRPWRLLPLAAGVTIACYAGLVALVCPAYLAKAVPMALALYGATDVTFLTLLGKSTLVIAGQAVAIGLLWHRWRGAAHRNLLLTLMLFAAVSTIVCFAASKDWYYHRLPATIITILVLIMLAGAEIGRHGRSIRVPLAAAVIAIAIFCVSTIQRIQPAFAQAVDPTDNVVERLERIIQQEHARTYVAFSEWLALGFPVVNNTGVTWASRFDSMWALKGEVWRARFDPLVAKEWPIARWVTHDFIAACPDLVVVDRRETTDYIKVLSAADPAFVRAWSRYHEITQIGGLAVYRRGKGGCLDVWVAATNQTPG